MIFDQLRSIRSVRPLIPDYSAESMLDTLDIIIKWLQVSVSDRSRQTLWLKIWFATRGLVPSDRVTCTIASRVNFFDTKLSLDVYVEVSSESYLLRASAVHEHIHSLTRNPNLRLPRESSRISSSLAVACARRLVSSTLCSFFATVARGGDIHTLTGKYTIDDVMTAYSPITVPMLVSERIWNGCHAKDCKL